MRTRMQKMSDLYKSYYDRRINTPVYLQDEVLGEVTVVDKVFTIESRIKSRVTTHAVGYLPRTKMKLVSGEYSLFLRRIILNTHKLHLYAELLTEFLHRDAHITGREQIITLADNAKMKELLDLLNAVFYMDSRPSTYPERL